MAKQNQNDIFIKSMKKANNNAKILARRIKLCFILVVRRVMATKKLQVRSDKNLISPKRSDMVLLPHNFTNPVIRLGIHNIHSLDIIDW